MWLAAYQQNIIFVFQDCGFLCEEDGQMCGQKENWNLWNQEKIRQR